jgi:molybdopterin-guanine dinucleotide biosynthesis protein A
MQSICFVLLSGGLSSRMSRDKGLILLGNKPLIQHVLDSIESFLQTLNLNSQIPVKIVLNNYIQQEEYMEAVPSLNEDQIIIDEVVWNKLFSDIPQPPRGSIFGLYTAMAELKSEFKNVFVLPCDTPLISVTVLSHIFNEYFKNDLLKKRKWRKIKSYFTYIPQWSSGSFEPFFSIYHIKSILPILEQKIFKKHYSFQKTFEEIRTNPGITNNIENERDYKIKIVPIPIEKELQKYDEHLYNFMDVDSEDNLKTIEEIISKNPHIKKDHSVLPNKSDGLIK